MCTKWLQRNSRKPVILGNIQRPFPVFLFASPTKNNICNSRGVEPRPHCSTDSIFLSSDTGYCKISTILRHYISLHSPTWHLWWIFYAGPPYNESMRFCWLYSALCITTIQTFSFWFDSFISTLQRLVFTVDCLLVFTPRVKLSAKI